MRTANNILFHYIPTYILTLTVIDSKVEAYGGVIESVYVSSWKSYSSYAL